MRTGLSLEAVKEERTFGGPGVGHPFQFGAQFGPMCRRFVAEFADVAGNFGTAVSRGDKVPIAFFADQRDQSGQGFLRTTMRYQICQE